MQPMWRPYRVLVSARMFRRGRLYKGRGPAHKGAYCAIEPCIGGYVLWNPDHTVESSRLARIGYVLLARIARDLQSRDGYVSTVQAGKALVAKQQAD